MKYFIIRLILYIIEFVKAFQIFLKFIIITT